MGSRVHSGAGPRELENAWLAELVADQEAVRRDPQRLREPLLLVLPSRSLRQHVLAQATQACQGALLGVQLCTPPELARRFFAQQPLRGQAFFSTLIERARVAERSPEQSAPARALVQGAVRDLIDALFTEELLEPCLQALESARLHSGARQRAERMLRIATASLQAAEAAGIAHSTSALIHGAQALRRGAALPARAIWIHGFTDATGASAEFLAALAQRPQCTVYLDRLPEHLPSGPLQGSFGQAWRERLALGPRPELPLVDAEVLLLRTKGPQAQVRAIAARVEAALDRGLQPERIAVVARDWDHLAAPLVRIFREMAIPCSGVDLQGSWSASARRRHAWLEVLEKAGSAPIERWWMSGAAFFAALPIHQAQNLILAAQVLGASQLERWAQLEIASVLGSAEQLRLPFARAARSEQPDEAESSNDVDSDSESEAEADSEEPLRGRSVPTAQIAACAQAARELLASLGRLREQRSTVAEQVPAWSSFLAAQFPSHWPVVEPILAELLEAAPPTWMVSGTEFLEVLMHALRRCEDSPLAGAGGGVQVLSVMEARGRSFDELFLVDLEAGVFPRLAREDALLSEAARLALASVLPDLALKTNAITEDRYYFESLLRSSPRVHLVWSVCDAQGEERKPSPFVERWLRDKQVALPSCELPVEQWTANPAATHAEWQRVAALRLGRSALEPTQRAVLDELEPSSARALPGLFLGRVGRRPNSANQTLWVSHLESLAECAWRTYLVRECQLGPAPDPDSSVPHLPAHVIGSTVHRVLERIAREALRQQPASNQWPERSQWQAWVYDAAREVAAQEQLMPLSLVHWLAQAALPYLEVALEVELSGPVQLLGVERTASYSLPSGRTLSFRADRVEQGPQGEVWVDFKTGKPFSTAQATTRESHQRRAVWKGTRLQAALYARASGAHGRYVYLKPGFELAQRLIDYSAGDPSVDKLDLSLPVLDQIWTEGAWVPRLSGNSWHQEPPACARCEVALACLRHDSGARRQVWEWTQRASSAEGLAQLPDWLRSAGSLVLLAKEAR